MRHRRRIVLARVLARLLPMLVPGQLVDAEARGRSVVGEGKPWPKPVLRVCYRVSRLVSHRGLPVASNDRWWSNAAARIPAFPTWAVNKQACVVRGVGAGVSP